MVALRRIIISSGASTFNTPKTLSITSFTLQNIEIERNESSIMHHAIDKKLVDRNLLEMRGDLFLLCLLSDRSIDNENNRYAFSRKLTNMLKSSIPITTVVGHKKCIHKFLWSFCLWNNVRQKWSSVLLFNVVLTGEVSIHAIKQLFTVSVFVEYSHS